MENNSFIINGIDVSQCKMFDGGLCKTDSVSFNCLACADNPDCYFKQLQRKNIEYNILNNKLNTICDHFDIEYLTNKETGELIIKSNNLLKKEQECEDYKNALLDKYKECDRYREALKDIKDLLFQVTHSDFDDEYKRAYKDLRNFFMLTQKQIADIINKTIAGKL